MAEDSARSRLELGHGRRFIEFSAVIAAEASVPVRLDLGYGKASVLVRGWLELGHGRRFSEFSSRDRSRGISSGEVGTCLWQKIQLGPVP